MPRGKLNEVYVKHIAVEWLEDYYRTRFDTQFVVSGVEARIRKNSPLGHGRADGLIAAKLGNGTFHTISLEAKSSRTWKSVQVRRHHLEMLLHATAFAGLVAVLVIVFGFSSTGGMFQGMFFPIVLIAIAGFCFMEFSPLNIHYHAADVINQVQRYPANDKWIALSADMYNRLVKEKREHSFEKICLKKGIGLIRISPSKKINLVLPPKSIATPKNLESFLVCYARAGAIQNEMALILTEPSTISEPLILDEPGRSNEDLNAAEIAEEDITVQEELTVLSSL